MTIVPWEEFIELAGAPPIPEGLGKYEKGIQQWQKAKFHKRGIGYDNVESSQAANRILCVADFRLEKGLATPGQLKMLRKLGYKDIKNITFQDAKLIIGNSYHW